MPAFTLSMTHRPERDGSTSTNSHVPFYLLLETMYFAWRAALAMTCEGILEPRDLGVVNVTSDFARELFTGDADFDVTLERIGTSSITFLILISQFGRPAATVRTTLAQVDETREHSVALSSLQRGALETLARL